MTAALGSAGAKRARQHVATTAARVQNASSRTEPAVFCAKDSAVWPPAIRSHRLWSLMHMLRFCASDFCASLGIFPQVWARLNSGMPIDDQGVRSLGGALGALQRHSEQLQLPVSSKQIESIRLQGMAPGTSFQTLGRMLTDLYGRLIDELDTRHLLLVDRTRPRLIQTRSRNGTSH
jgi:hypothetical protein